MVPELTIRPLLNVSEFHQAQDVMEKTWGGAENNIVPVHVLIATVHSGGLVAGVFAGDLLIGFSYAFPGIMGGEVLLYSHMTAVLPEHRGRGVGRQLKQFQRCWALEHGFEHIRWTFDPLIAANARFNLHCLGARAVSYLVDFYGQSRSQLHGIGPTDRFEVEWDLNSPRSVALARGEEAPVLEAVDGTVARLYELESRPGGYEIPGEITVPNPDEVPYILAPIPHDFLDLCQRERSVAESWRFATRHGFQRALEAGYHFVDCVEPMGGGESRSRPNYLLAPSTLRWSAPAR